MADTEEKKAKKSAKAQQPDGSGEEQKAKAPKAAKAEKAITLRQTARLPRPKSQQRRVSPSRRSRRG